MKQAVFNLPDDMTRNEFKFIDLTRAKMKFDYILGKKDLVGNNDSMKDNVTERLGAARQAKFNELWSEFLNKLTDLNKVMCLFDMKMNSNM
jgi:hypothetical protein